MANRKILRVRKSGNGNEGISQPTNTESSEPVAASSNEFAVIAPAADFDADECITVNPADIGSDNGNSPDGEPRKKRGRKPGSKNKRTAETSQDLTTLLYSMHLMGAALLQSPELILGQDDAEQLSNAITRVNEVYGGVVVPERVMCLINLGMVGCKVYAPRVVAIARRVSATKKAGKPQPVNFAGHKFDGAIPIPHGMKPEDVQ